MEVARRPVGLPSAAAAAGGRRPAPVARVAPGADGVVVVAAVEAAVLVAAPVAVRRARSA
ncbi:hypothetical protein OG259_21110 [Streptomyces sp. NBC_00250]|uniref:hypothetical protein n=1 Tax=Streptomyces sp. NBC_00250 TaxID=2903641 RepID=UPI002E2CA6DB|nr:hypothetical protein [Streptomyces sp. NBC_00250]